MKVVREKQEFTPIIIAIESEDEARLLWQLLNMSWMKLQDVLDNNYKMPQNVNDVRNKMFLAFNEVFNGLK